LTEGGYKGVIYKDPPDAGKSPNQLQEEPFVVEQGHKQTIHLAAGGGAVIVLKK